MKTFTIEYETYNLSAERGDRYASDFREILAEDMIEAINKLLTYYPPGFAGKQISYIYEMGEKKSYERI